VRRKASLLHQRDEKEEASDYPTPELPILNRQYSEDRGTECTVICWEDTTNLLRGPSQKGKGPFTIPRELFPRAIRRSVPEKAPLTKEAKSKEQGGFESVKCDE